MLVAQHDPVVDVLAHFQRIFESVRRFARLHGVLVRRRHILARDAEFIEAERILHVRLEFAENRHGKTEGQKRCERLGTFQIGRLKGQEVHDLRLAHFGHRTKVRFHRPDGAFRMQENAHLADVRLRFEREARQE